MARKMSPAPVDVYRNVRFTNRGRTASKDEMSVVCVKHPYTAAPMRGKPSKTVMARKFLRNQDCRGLDGSWRSEELSFVSWFSCSRCVLPEPLELLM